MTARSRRASGRVTPKGTVNRPASPTPAAPSPETSPRQRAIEARRSADRGFGGARSGGRPPVVFRRSGHR